MLLSKSVKQVTQNTYVHEPNQISGLSSRGDSHESLLSYDWSVVHSVAQRAKIPDKSRSFRNLDQKSFCSSHVLRNWDFLQDLDGLMKLPL